MSVESWFRRFRGVSGVRFHRFCGVNGVMVS